MKISPVLRKYPDGYGWWCPGCKHAHYVEVGRSEHPVWTFDGNVDAPTFGPSVRVFFPAIPARDGFPALPEVTVCHFFVEKGSIRFLNDCRHELAGQTVPMTLLDTIVNYSWGDGDG